MRTIARTTKITTIIAFVGATFLSGCGAAGDGGSTASKAELDSLRAQITALTVGNFNIAKNLAAFDTLDFVVYSGQQWARMHESHTEDVKVHWPDGHVTEGLGVHVEDLKKMFVFAPDTRVSSHPISFGSGSMTAVTGIFEGTFTQPMPIGNGKFIEPTGKAFKLPMCTIGMWNTEGLLYEEHLFWDNQAFVQQIGLGQ